MVQQKKWKCVHVHPVCILVPYNFILSNTLSSVGFHPSDINRRIPKLHSLHCVQKPFPIHLNSLNYILIGSFFCPDILDYTLPMQQEHCFNQLCPLHCTCNKTRRLISWMQQHVLYLLSSFMIEEIYISGMDGTRVVFYSNLVPELDIFFFPDAT